MIPIFSPVVIVYPCEGKHVICLECFASYCKISLENRRFVHHAEVGYSLPCPGTVNPEIFARILFSRIALKGIFVMLKFATRA